MVVGMQIVGPEPQWRKKKRRRESIIKAISYFLTTLLALLFAAPFLLMLSMSLQSLSQLAKYPPEWIPRPIQWENYPKALSYPQRPFLVFLRNSLIYTELATLGATLSSAFVAFGFSRVDWPLRDKTFVLVLSTMMLPYQVVMIPQYILFNHLGWTNSLKPLVVPAWFGRAFYIFLLRQFFMTIPRELDEAAILDGCDYLTTWWSIIMPLSKPALVTVVTFSIVRTWNDFLQPLIYLTSTRKMTVSLGLRVFQRSLTDSGGFVAFGQVMAIAVLSLLPMLVLFIAAQRYFVTGIAMTGMKGG